MAARRGSRARANPASITVPDLDALMRMVGKLPDFRDYSHGTERVVKPTYDRAAFFGELCQRVFSTWPASVPVDILTILVFAEDDEWTAEDGNSDIDGLEYACLAFENGKFRARMSNEYEDDPQDMVWVQADVGNMLVDEAGAAADELSAAGWRDGGDIWDPPEGVVEGTAGEPSEEEKWLDEIAPRDNPTWDVPQSSWVITIPDADVMLEAAQKAATKEYEKERRRFGTAKEGFPTIRHAENFIELVHAVVEALPEGLPDASPAGHPDWRVSRLRITYEPDKTRVYFAYESDVSEHYNNPFYVMGIDHVMNWHGKDIATAYFDVNPAKDQALIDELVSAGWTYDDDGPPRCLAPAWVAERVGRAQDVDKPYEERMMLRHNPQDAAGADVADVLEEAIEEPKRKATKGKPRGQVVKDLDAGAFEQIVRVQSTGDDTAATWLYNRFKPYADNFATKYLQGAIADGKQTGTGKRSFFAHKNKKAAAKEVADEALARILTGAGTSDGTPVINKYKENTAASFATFISGVIKNVAKERARKYARQSELPEAPTGESAIEQIPDSSLPTAEEALIESESEVTVQGRELAREQSAAIAAALSSGALKQSEIDILRMKMQGKRYKEIAADLGIGVDAVGLRLYRARKALEEASGVPLRGIVVEQLGGLRPDRRGRKRKNPSEPALYFEEMADLDDLLEVGCITDVVYEQCAAEWARRFT